MRGTVRIEPRGTRRRASKGPFVPDGLVVREGAIEKRPATKSDTGRRRTAVAKTVNSCVERGDAFLEPAAWLCPDPQLRPHWTKSSASDGRAPVAIASALRSIALNSARFQWPRRRAVVKPRGVKPDRTRHRRWLRAGSLARANRAARERLRRRAFRTHAGKVGGPRQPAPLPVHRTMGRGRGIARRPCAGRIR